MIRLIDAENAKMGTIKDRNGKYLKKQGRLTRSAKNTQENYTTRP